ncbi:MAG: 3-dehydroquinate synthase [Corynebacterium sp.]|nr:3-dehydroquinate synthase [Corynebacterium sp.]
MTNPDFAQNAHFDPITVNGYQVHFGYDLIPDIADCAQVASKVAVIYQPGREVDALCAALHDRGLETFAFEIPDAEEAKSVATCEALWDRLGEENFSRGDLIIGFGGGAATDLAGFIAATWMRGIKVIQVPTTLLAMVDAAVGGKTGINTAAGKNLVGSFHEPYAVFIDMKNLETLPPGELIAGSAEIIKTGFIGDPEILTIYETDPDNALGSRLPELIYRSVTVKGRVVSADLKESNLREILNYGHTFGHAVEHRENYKWRHGKAVAVGLMFVAHLAHNRGLIDSALLDRHRAILSSVGLPTSYEDGAFEELYEGMTHDKKNKNGKIRFVALDGAVDVVTRIEGPSREELETAYAQLVAEGE